MGFTTPAWISQLPAAPTENAIDAGNKGALAGYQLGQTKAVRGALQGLDINDPASTNAAIGALVRAGAVDQAGGLMNLNFTRDMRSRIPGLLDQLSHSGQTQTSQQPAATTSDGTMSPEQAQHAADTMSQGVDTLKSIRDLPPDQRAAAFAAAKPTFVQRGIPEAAVDAIGADIGDDAKLDQHIAYLSAHADHFGGQAQPNAVPAAGPDMAHPNNFAWATNVESNPQLQLGIAMAKSAGLDLSGLTDTAKALVLPQIEAQAKAQYAAQTAQGTTSGTNVANADPNTAPPPFKGAVRGPDGNWVMAPGAIAGQTTEAANTALGSMAGSNGGEVATRADGSRVVVPVSGATGTAAAFEGGVTGAKTTAESGARAPYAPVEIKMADGSTMQAIPDGQGGFAQVHGASPGVGQSPSPAQAALNKASADQLVSERQSSGQLQTQLVPLRTAYDLIRQGKVHLGPGSDTLNRMRSFVTSTLGIGDQAQVANYDQVHKYLVQIANQRAQQFGQGTNEKLAVAASGSPNVDMSNLGAQEVLRMNIALARAEAAKSASYNGPPQGYTAYAANYGQTVDPRAFMLDLLPKADRDTMIASIRPAERAAFARGILTAERAGYYNRNKLPGVLADAGAAGSVQ